MPTTWEICFAISALIICGPENRSIGLNLSHITINVLSLQVSREPEIWLFILFIKKKKKLKGIERVMIFKGFAVSVNISVEKRFVYNQKDKSQAAFP